MDETELQWLGAGGGDLARDDNQSGKCLNERRKSVNGLNGF
jgi:hypothetical protein